jgi:hypothetical protein
MSDILKKHEIDPTQLTEEQIQNVMNNHTVRYGVMYTPSGMGIESNRKVRICRAMVASDVSRFGQQVRCQMHGIGTAANFIADFVLRETIQRLKVDGLFKQEVKKICNELQGVIQEWKTNIKVLLGERYVPMEEVAFDRMGDLYKDMEQLRMQIKQYFHKRKNKRAETCSWVEMTQQMFVVSHLVVKSTVQNWYNEVGIDFSEVFAHMDLLRKCSRKWQKVCMHLYAYEEQVQLVQCDRNFANALLILSKGMCDYDGLLVHIKDVVHEYADLFSEQDKKAIEADIECMEKEKAAKRAAAEKANAEYWTNAAKKRSSDITQDDLKLLKEHFQKL